MIHINTPFQKRDFPVMCHRTNRIITNAWNWQHFQKRFFYYALRNLIDLHAARPLSRSQTAFHAYMTRCIFIARFLSISCSNFHYLQPWVWKCTYNIHLPVMFSCYRGTRHSENTKHLCCINHWRWKLCWFSKQRKWWELSFIFT